MINVILMMLKFFFFEYSLESVLKEAFEVRDLLPLIDEYRFEFGGKDPEKLYNLTSGSGYKRLERIAIHNEYNIPPRYR